MGYKLELDLPNYGKGVEVYLEGLGILENGGTYEVSDEEAAAFRVVHQIVTYHTNPDTGMVTHTTEEPGPTVLEYFKDREGIKVSASKKKSKDAEETPPGQTHGGPQSTSPVVPDDNTDPVDGSTKPEGGDGQ
jgi:hypothetical protein